VSMTVPFGYVDLGNGGEGLAAFAGINHPF
jgi:hypothetical protein